MSERPALADPIIVVVEDEALVRELAVCELEESGFRVAAFDTADAALAFLLTGAAGVGGIFTDVQTPGRLSGLDLAALVERSWPGMPVLVTSGGAGVDQRYLPACASFIPKPWRGREVVRRVERMTRPPRGPRGPAPAPRDWLRRSA